jgi:hypothetical protein
MGFSIGEKEKFDGTNWFHFAPMARALLGGKAVGHAIAPADANEPVTTAHNRLAKALLLQSVKTNYIILVDQAATARDAWVALEAVHKPRPPCA